MNIWTKIVAGLLVIAMAAGLAYAIVAGYEHFRAKFVAQGDKQGAARVTMERDKLDIERAAAAAETTRLAVKAERETAERSTQGERDARKKYEAKTTLELADAKFAASVSSSLSGHLAALDATARDLDLSNIAACPGQLVEQRALAVRARKLFGACVAEYTSLGAGVDEANRAITLKLDTALGYINAVKPLQ